MAPQLKETPKEPQVYYPRKISLEFIGEAKINHMVDNMFLRLPGLVVHNKVYTWWNLNDNCNVDPTI